MKICFVLSQILKKPIGGYKIVYEYANRLVQEGHEVGILFLNDHALERFHFPEPVRKAMVAMYTKTEPKWFPLDSRVKKWSSTNKTIKEKVKDTDLAVATCVNTVQSTLEYFPDSHKAYLIQDYETWVYSEEKVQESYALGMDNIVISEWLKKIVDQYSKTPSLLIKDAIDINIYRNIVPVEDRDENTIGVLYHTAEHKGFQYAYQAILKLKEKFPKLHVKMFGTSQPEEDFPDWIDFKLNATQAETVEIYNSVAVFLCATVKEGYGLTGLESMACGAALVSTEYLGVKEYAQNDYNALLSPVRDVDSLVNNVSELILNKEKRVRIAKNGVESSRNLSWENAISLFNTYLDTLK